MTSKAVHWDEGMFLRPQHFQAAARHDQWLLHQHIGWSQHYYWGIHRLIIDPDALASGQFVVRELEARLRDGTLVVLAELTYPLSLDLQPVLQQNARVEVRLAVPRLRPSSANLEQPGQPGRFQVLTLPIEDENTGTNPQPLKFQALQARLLTTAGDEAGYEVLTLARLTKADRPEAPPEIDPDYIPALLSSAAWRGLQEDILQQLYFRLRKKSELLAAQVVSRGITLDSRSPGDAVKVAQLRILHEAAAVLDATAFIPGIHPLEAYRDLCRIVGQLAIFAPDRRCPELPRYDHDDLGRVFQELKRLLDRLLNQVEEPVVLERTFVGEGTRMVVSLDRDWLQSDWQMFLGVRVPQLSSADCVRLLTRPEKLGMKIGAADQVERLFRRGEPGMMFTPASNPPRDLPAGWTYFELSREPQADWQKVQDSLSLAIRLDLKRALGNFEGQEQVTIETESEVATFRFTLFVLPATRLG